MTEVSIVQGATEVSVVGAIPLVDDQAITFGTDGTVELKYNVDDANANLLMLLFPEGGAVDVPVFVLGDATTDKDLTFFNGITEPTLAIINDAGDAYVSLDAGDDSVATAKGLYFYLAADEDVEIINLSVTGTPRLYWDESQNSIRLTSILELDNHLYINNNKYIYSTAGPTAVAQISDGGFFSVLGIRMADTKAISGGIASLDYFTINVYNTADPAWKEVVRFTNPNGAGETGEIGFFGATPVQQQTGVAVNAAGIHAALVNYGIITA
tara:strand:+ start:21189 stop:21995 length:807 start_codon:yes stop_codon:yes gene_type:complete